ncbi:MAG TPA: GNAT family N-acetyltransferase [Gemmatimonadales bacterium]|nr:GNAT family N-acetyltransferase [Gemmatimonadales bacterium]
MPSPVPSVPQSSVSFPVPLHTDRLTLRGPDPARADTINAAIRDSFAELSAWLPWADHVPSLDETREHLTKAHAAFEANDDCGLFIWDRISERFIGAIGLHQRLADPKRREMGYWIRTSAAGNGYATEAVRAVSRAALEHLALSALEIHVNPGNVASRRVALAAGFVYAGEIAGRPDPDGQPTRVLVYVLEAPLRR